jgi:hypothetical protein
MVQFALTRGGPEADALRGFVADLLDLDVVNRFVASEVSGIGYRYDLGDDHPLVGRRIPARSLSTADGPTSTVELLHRARGVLLDLTGDAGLAALADGWADRVTTVTATGPVDGLHDVRAVLVRPDGHVAWVGPVDAEPDLDGLVTALNRWFGDASAGAGERRMTTAAGAVR